MAEGESPADEATAADEPVVAPSVTTGATVLQFPDRRADTVVIAPGAEAEDDIDRRRRCDDRDDDVARARRRRQCRDRRADAAVEVDEVDDDEITANDVDNLFARLRSQNDETTDARRRPSAAGHRTRRPRSRSATRC